MIVAALTLRRLSGRPVVSLAMLCLLFLTCAPLWSATAAGAGAPPISGSAVTPNSLPPGLGGYPTYLGGSGGYPGSSYPGSSYPGYPGGNGGYPGYPGGNAGYPGYPGGSISYPGGGLNQQSGYPSYGSTGADACTLCYWRNNYYQWYRQAYATYEQMSYDPCLVCSYSYYSGR